ncbi:hypothetical protein WKI65_44085 [Streptomyces sp. MS1.AVA.3]
MSNTTSIYDDGATYGPDENALDATAPVDGIYDDGATYGTTKEN